MTKFKVALLVGFGLFAAAGIVGFATYQGSSNNTSLPSIVMWGIIDKDVFDALFRSQRMKDTGINVTYVEKDPSSFEEELLNALASGRAPDLVALPHDLIYSQRDKFVIIPWESYPERDFRDTFIDGAEIFTSSAGVLGIPFTVDPLVMYWNRNDFRNANITLAPSYWDQFFTLAPQFFKKDGAGNIQKSLVALGEYSNISNVKEILSTLMFQAGTPITRINQGRFENVLNDRFNYPTAPAEASLRFFIEFSNSAKPSYSWNKAQPLSRDAFLQEKTAIYFAPASELQSIRNRNPNLNFDVSVVPQIRDAKAKYSYARMTALVIPKGSTKIDGAFRTALLLTSKESLAELSTISLLPPIRRDLLAEVQTEAYKTTFYKSAIISKTWIDPDPKATNQIFQRMIESSVSGRESVTSALARAASEFRELIK